MYPHLSPPTPGRLGSHGNAPVNQEHVSGVCNSGDAYNFAGPLSNQICDYSRIYIVMSRVFIGVGDLLCASLYYFQRPEALGA